MFPVTCKMPLACINVEMTTEPHERTSAGREAAKAKGVRFGRPPTLSAEQIAHARQLISEDKKPAEVARLLGVHRATLYRALERNDVNTH